MHPLHAPLPKKPPRYRNSVRVLLEHGAWLPFHAPGASSSESPIHLRVCFAAMAQKGLGQIGLHSAAKGLKCMTDHAGSGAEVKGTAAAGGGNGALRNPWATDTYAKAKKNPFVVLLTLNKSPSKCL